MCFTAKAFTLVVILICVCLQQQYSDFPSGYVSEADFWKGKEGAGCCVVSRSRARVGWGRDKVVGRRLLFTQTS